MAIRERCPLQAALRAGLCLWALALASWSGYAAASGPALYQRHCAVCHGASGQGDGPAAGLLSPRPRDFTRGLYKFRSTPSGSLPPLQDIARTIREGLPGTSMPSYRALLSEGEIQALARVLLAKAPREQKAAGAIVLGAAPAASPASVERGSYLYARERCLGCHGADGRASGWRPEREEPGGGVPPRDLSAPWTFRRGPDRESIVRVILTGLDGTMMPAYAGRLTSQQAWDLADYVGSLARRPAWAERDPARVRSAGVAVDALDRGRYLVNAMLCPLCHTPISPRDGSYETRLFLAGGMRVSAYPWGVWYSRNLTGDAETGLGRWSEADIVAALTRGVRPDGRRLDPMAMPWPWFSRLTTEDARAIATYLKALPGVRNAVPEPERISMIEAVGGKLLGLLGREVAVEFWGGNAATDTGLRNHVPVSAGLRIGALALGASTLLIAAMLLIGAWHVHRRTRSRPGADARAVRSGRLRPARGLVGLVVLGAWVLLGQWPPLTLMSPDVTVRWLFLGEPELPASLGEVERALVERGRYLVAVAPCGLCHTPAGAFVGFYTGRTLAGGMEGRWRVYGSAVSSNLTPHATDGIGAVPQESLLRAMRSGIGTDGRSLHWQAMPWDIGSHWSEEDLRAMVAYLRVLPPVAGTMPSPRGPRDDDPAADAFLFGDAALTR